MFANLLTACSLKDCLTRQTDSREALYRGRHTEWCHRNEIQRDGSGGGSSEEIVDVAHRLIDARARPLRARSTECSVIGRPDCSLYSRRVVLASLPFMRHRVPQIIGNARLRKLSVGRRRNSRMIYPNIFPIFVNCMTIMCAP